MMKSEVTLPEMSALLEGRVKYKPENSENRLLLSTALFCCAPIFTQNKRNMQLKCKF